MVSGAQLHAFIRGQMGIEGAQMRTFARREEGGRGDCRHLNLLDASVDKTSPEIDSSLDWRSVRFEIFRNSSQIANVSQQAVQPYLRQAMRLDDVRCRPRRCANEGIPGRLLITKSDKALIMASGTSSVHRITSWIVFRMSICISQQDMTSSRRIACAKFAGWFWVLSRVRNL